MAEFEHISGLNSTNDNDALFNKHLENTNKKKKAESKVDFFKIGEIIRATIIDYKGNNVFRIKIPNGEFNAVTSGELKNGDSLFFQVKQLQPNLILRPHSIIPMQGSTLLSELEISRMLDLPRTNEILNIIKYYTNKVNYVQKDTVANALISLDSIQHLLKKNENFNEVLNIIDKVTSVYGSFSINYFEKLSPSNRIKNNLTSLIKLLQEFSKLQYLNNLLPNILNQITIPENLNSVSTIEMLSDFIISVQGLPDSNTKKKLLEELTNTNESLASFYLWNAIEDEKAIGIYLLPIFVNNQWQIISAEYERVSESNSQYYKIQFDLITSNFGRINAKCTFYNDIVNIVLNAEENEIVFKELAENELNQLNQQFQIIGLHINSFISNKLETKSKKSNSSLKTNISVVI